MKQFNSKHILVGVFQDGEEIENRIIRDHDDVTIGESPTNTFTTPHPGLPDSYHLFEFVGGRYHIRIHENVTGHVAIGGRWSDIGSLRASPLGQSNGSDVSLPLDENSTGTVHWANYTFSFHFVGVQSEPGKRQSPPDIQSTFKSFWKSNRLYLQTVVGLVLLCALVGVSSSFMRMQDGKSKEESAFVDWLVKKAQEKAACETECGTWENNTCTPALDTKAIAMAECEKTGGTWGNDVCTSADELTGIAEAECEKAGGIWENDACTSADELTAIAMAKCKKKKGTWKNGACIVKPIGTSQGEFAKYRKKLRRAISKKHGAFNACMRQLPPANRNSIANDWFKLRFTVAGSGKLQPVKVV
jgi:hypothetical protein